MAKNKDEITSESNVKLVPTITDDILKAFINNDLIPNLVLRKDKIGTATPAGGNVTADFTTNDLVAITATSSVVVSFSGLVNGDVKYMQITKPAGATIAFSGATNITNFHEYINNSTLVLYSVTNKNNNIFVLALRQTIIAGSSAFIENRDTERFALCSSVYDYVTPIVATLQAAINDAVKRVALPVVVSTGWTLTNTKVIKNEATATIQLQIIADLAGTTQYIRILTFQTDEQIQDQFVIGMRRDSLGGTNNYPVCMKIQEYEGDYEVVILDAFATTSSANRHVELNCSIMYNKAI